MRRSGRRSWTFVCAALAMGLAAGGRAAAAHHHHHHHHHSSRPPTSRPVIAGPYAGVVPGEPNPPVRPLRPGTTPAALTWPGFQLMPDGTSRVFVQLTAPVQYTTTQKDKQVVILLEGAHIHLRNNERPLDTRYFRTPLLDARVKPARGGVQLLLTLREAVPVNVHLETAPTGYSFLFVDLPAYGASASAP